MKKCLKKFLLIVGLLILLTNLFAHTIYDKLLFIEKVDLNGDYQT